MHLVFLHAFPLDHTMWEQQLGVVPGYCDAPALYSYGSSLENWAKGAISSIGTNKAIAIGASIGGSCAIEMARQASSQIAALVLVATKAGHRPDLNARDNYIDKLRKNGVKEIWPTVSSWVGPATPPCVVDTIRRIAFAQSTKDLANAVHAFHGRADLTDVVSQWEKPLLVVSGDADPVVTEQKAAVLAGLTPNAKLHVISGCGHFVNMERPGEFNGILTDFVQSVEAN